MIEVIGVAEPGSDHYEVRDMYVPPEDSDFVVCALKRAVRDLSEWRENVIVSGRLWAEGTELVDLSTLDEKIDACYQMASKIPEIAAVGSMAHIPEPWLVYEGMMYGLGRMANLESRRGNVLDGLLWAMDFTVDSWPRRRIGVQKRAELLDEYLGRISYIRRTPDEYRAARI